ncbi:MAG: Crp/Fnr family transcriptional regulator [Candidatus Promineifilaceae bacterium]
MSNLDAHHGVADLLSSIPYFAHVDTHSLNAIARSALRKRYDADQVVLLEGEPSSGLFVVQEGWLKSVKTSPEGREQVMRVVGPGDVFNAIGVLASTTNPGTVIALEPATVWILQRKTLLQMLEENAGLAWMIIQALAERVQRLMSQVEDLSLRSVETRLARLLLEEATGETLVRRPWDTQAEMAARLGTVLDVLNRALRRMDSAGIIKVERHRILILDQEQLTSIADLDT